ncbi:hypothetical protein ACOSQ2_029104 [Xanthoceras sorbifolium]
MDPQDGYWNLEPSLRKWSFGSTSEVGDGAKAPSSQEIAGACSPKRAQAILKNKGPDCAGDLVVHLEMEPLSSISFRCGRWSPKLHLRRRLPTSVRR